MQRTDGFYTHDETTGLLQTMKNGNIVKNIIFGLPVEKKWEYFELVEPSYYLDNNSKCTYFASTDKIFAYQYKSLKEEDKALIAPTINGFGPTNLSAIEYIKELWRKHPFWKGVGEVLFRHDDLTDLTIGETARCNHPAMAPIYRFCVEEQIPINIHQNSNLSSAVSSLLLLTGTFTYTNWKKYCPIPNTKT
ncbi:MAG: hypothetical protein SWO11_19620 [Thermodesulfobacteriota bacterium]|nr:hypothetical protein [Thermodesulfobacteriota bacterium]